MRQDKEARPVLVRNEGRCIECGEALDWYETGFTCELCEAGFPHAIGGPPGRGVGNFVVMADDPEDPERKEDQ